MNYSSLPVKHYSSRPGRENSVIVACYLNTLACLRKAVDVDGAALVILAERLIADGLAADRACLAGHGWSGLVGGLKPHDAGGVIGLFQLQEIPPIPSERHVLPLLSLQPPIPSDRIVLPSPER